MKQDWRRSTQRDAADMQRQYLGHQQMERLQQHANNPTSHQPTHTQTTQTTQTTTPEQILNSQLDTNIGNYNLQEILQLFKLPPDFNELDLKRAKRTTMKTHPDVSNLPQDYFQFFSKAYRMLEQIYECRHSKILKENEIKQRDSALYMNTSYEVQKDKEKEILLKDITKKDDFNDWFNGMFQKINTEDEENDRGYEDWLRSDADIDTHTPQIKQSEMDSYFENRKRNAAQQFSLMKRQDILEFNQNGASQGHYEIDRSGTNSQQYSYSSGVFDKLQFEDLKKAHTESVIPVCTQTELENRPDFKNLDEYQNYRNNQNIMAMTEEQTKAHMTNLVSRNSQIETQRIFNILKQDEAAQQRQDQWWSSIRTIKNESPSYQYTDRNYQ